jgi:hypothetical protein
MDSTTVILPRHHGLVDKAGSILIYPDGYQANGASASRPKSKVAAKKGATRKAKPAQRKASGAKARSKARK